MLCTPMVTTSSTATVSSVWYGSLIRARYGEP